MKKCSKCHKELPLKNFYKDKSKKSGIRGYCKTCDTQRAKIYYKNNPEIHRKASYKYSIKHRYGISLETYQEMCLRQNNVCKICREKCSLKQKLSIDHNHETGEIRGLLCDNCNNGIARFKDNPELMKSAIRYITKG